MTNINKPLNPILKQIKKKEGANSSILTIGGTEFTCSIHGEVPTWTISFGRGDGSNFGTVTCCNKCLFETMKKLPGIAMIVESEKCLKNTP